MPRKKVVKKTVRKHPLPRRKPPQNGKGIKKTAKKAIKYAGYGLAGLTALELALLSAGAAGKFIGNGYQFSY